MSQVYENPPLVEASRKQNIVIPETRLRPQNRQALALLQAWLAESDDLDDEWWDEFEQDLKRHRFALVYLSNAPTRC